MTEVVVGLDASTTAVKCVAWDRVGTAVAEARAPVPLATVAGPGYEQDPEDWWRAMREATRKCVGRLPPDVAIAGLSIAHQRETFVPVNRRGEAVHPAIVWMDERCAAEVARVRQQEDAESIHLTTGKQVCTTPSVYKWLWLSGRREMPQDVVLLDAHAFLVHRMTSTFVTSVPSADPMGLIGQPAGLWSSTMLKLAGITEANLPFVVPVGHRIGLLGGDTGSELGLPPDVPIFAGAGDGQAAALGVGLTGPGLAYLNVGTAVVSGLVYDKYVTSEAFRTLAAATPGAFLLESDLKGGTFTLNWLAGFLGVSDEDRADELAMLEARARSIPPGSEGLMVVPYWAGVMNPFWDDGASGITVGWQGHHEPAHLYRAIVEGIAFEERLHLEGLEEAIGEKVGGYLVTGGGSQSDLWCQILADTTGRMLVRSAASEATSLGAGIIAAVGAGWYASHGEATAAMCHDGDQFTPGPAASRYAELYDRYRRIYPALR